MRNPVVHPGKKLLQYIYANGDSTENPLRLAANISKDEWYGFISGTVDVNDYLAERLVKIVPGTDEEYWKQAQAKYDLFKNLNKSK